MLAGSTGIFYSSILFSYTGIRLSISFGIRKFLICLTIALFSFFMPQLLTAVFFSTINFNSVSLGIIVGLNIANTALVIGIISLIKPLIIDRSIMKFEFILLLIIYALFYVLSIDSILGYFDAMFTFIFFTLFSFLSFMKSRNSEKIEAEDKLYRTKKNYFLIICGALLLIISTFLIADGAIIIIDKFKLNGFIFGITAISTLIVIPETAFLIYYSIKHKEEFSISKILSSNIYTLLGITAIVTAFNPIKIEDYIINFHYPVMIGFLLIVITLIFFYPSLRITRHKGFILVFLYILYLASMVL